jgi:hypothetical protein
MRWVILGLWTFLAVAFAGDKPTTDQGKFVPLFDGKTFEGWEGNLKVFRKRDQWNDYVIRCEKDRVQLWINGHKTADYIEKDPAIPRTGVIGLQIHGGPPSEAWSREIAIKEL